MQQGAAGLYTALLSRPLCCLQIQFCDEIVRVWPHTPICPHFEEGLVHSWVRISQPPHYVNEQKDGYAEFQKQLIFQKPNFILGMLPQARLVWLRK